MSKPTPRPWMAVPSTRDEYAIYQPNDKPFDVFSIARCSLRDNNEANAAHIVKCVNMHDALVRALRDTYDLHFTGDGPTLKQIEELLAKAEAE